MTNFMEKKYILLLFKKSFHCLQDQWQQLLLQRVSWISLVILWGHNLWVGCQSRLKTPITDWIMAITHQLSTQYFCRTRKWVDKTIFFLNSKHLKVSHESVFQIWTTNVGENFPISKKPFELINLKKFWDFK